MSQYHLPIASMNSTQTNHLNNRKKNPIKAPMFLNVPLISGLLNHKKMAPNAPKIHPISRKPPFGLHLGPEAKTQPFWDWAFLMANQSTYLPPPKVTPPTQIKPYEKKGLIKHWFPLRQAITPLFLRRGDVGGGVGWPVIRFWTTSRGNRTNRTMSQEYNPLGVKHVEGARMC